MMRPLIDDDDLRADLFDHFEDVRDVQDHFAAAGELAEQVLEEQGGSDVDAGERFVEDQYVGVMQQRGGDQDALLHALGVGGDGRVAVRVQLEELQQIVGLAFHFARAASRAGSP